MRFFAGMNKHVLFEKMKRKIKFVQNDGRQLIEAIKLPAVNLQLD